jgi:hypothetical protein
MTTFLINDVTPPADPRLATVDGPTWTDAYTARPKQGKQKGGQGRGAGAAAASKHADSLVAPDAYSAIDGVLERQSHGHGFIAAITTAFDNHLPLTLRPEHFWLLTLQAVARHVKDNAEELRDRFVAHDGKRELDIYRDDWGGGPGTEGYDWAGVVSEFATQIDAATVPGVAHLTATDFSSSTPEEVVAGKVVVMDMLQEFFAYTMHTRCGYPSITLEGTAADWHKLRAKVLALVAEKCTPALADSWGPALQSALDRFVDAVDHPDKVDTVFWQAMCKRGGVSGSGGRSWLNGWYNVFFPFLREGRPNEYCVPYTPEIGYAQEAPKVNRYGMRHDMLPGVAGPTPTDLPGGMSVAPVTWDFLGTKLALSFKAGFGGAAQCKDTNAIAPTIGWCIMRDGW